MSNYNLDKEALIKAFRQFCNEWKPQEQSYGRPTVDEQIDQSPFIMLELFTNWWENQPNTEVEDS